MCRMRSIRETAAIFKGEDPHTQMTECTLRNLVASGSIPYIKTGNKVLINVDQLLQILSSPVEATK